MLINLFIHCKVFFNDKNVFWIDFCGIIGLSCYNASFSI